ncbi:RBBP9/YdeN family alpha/beta hydrolase [Gordonia sp. NPDC003424]
MTADPTVVIVPGLRGYVADHWQTHLAAELLADGIQVRTVRPLEHDKLSRQARVAALDTVVGSIDGPVVLVAHSAGVLTTVHWAQRTTHDVQGALLVTPADVELPLPDGYPSAEELEYRGWMPIPRRRLPFPSIVAASRTDLLGGYRRISGMAEVWGSRLVDLGDVGHLNAASGFGRWAGARELVEDLIAHTAEVVAVS